MKWRRVDKSATVQPTAGKYPDWKPILAKEANNLCVYCCISDAHFGGIRNFHVEHYRPKKKFPKLEHVISNLFYSCSICNVFKGEDWPNEPAEANFDYVYYPDPSTVNYADLFKVDIDSARVSGENVAARYLVEKLYLNRAQMLRNRKLLLLADQLLKLKDQLNEAAKIAELDECRRVADVLGRIAELFHGLWTTSPYEASEIQR